MRQFIVLTIAIQITHYYYNVTMKCKLVFLNITVIKQTVGIFKLNNFFLAIIIY